MAGTKIEWADAVWNPSTGCTEVSDGCMKCYARIMAERLQAMGQAKYANGFAYTEHRGALGLPSTWRRSKRIFVNSMSDLFHEDASYEFVAAALTEMVCVDHHTYLVLTKRAGKMRHWVSRFCREGGLERLPPHIWLGVSVEDQAAASLRIPPLLKAPCATRFVSAEPLLGPVALWSVHDGRGWAYQALAGWAVNLRAPELPSIDTARIDWVIAGGESGRDARPCDPAWVQSLRDQCADFGAAFFFKQWGGAHHAAGGRQLDGRTWDEAPPEPWRRPATAAWI